MVIFFHLPTNVGLHRKWTWSPLAPRSTICFKKVKAVCSRPVSCAISKVGRTAGSSLQISRKQKEEKKHQSVFWRLLKLAAVKKQVLLLAALSLACATGAALLQPFTFGQVLATLISFASSPGVAARRALHRSLLKVVVLYALEVTSTYCYIRCMTATTDGVLSDLRKLVYRHVLRQDAAFFDTAGSTSELTAAVSYDIDEVKGGIYNNLQRDRGLRAYMESLGALVFVSRMSIKICLIFVLVVPAVALACAQFGKYMGRIAVEERRELGKTAEVANEVISNMKTVKLYGAEDREARRFGGLVEQALSVSYIMGDTKGKLECFNRFAIYVTLLSILYFGGSLVAMGEIPIAVFVSSMGYSWLLVFGLQGCSFTFSDVPRVGTALRRVFDTIDKAVENESQREGRGNVLLGNVVGRVVFENVRFAYPIRKHVEVLHGLNLTLLPSKVTALVGPSGSGKSTIASLLSRFYEPDSGRILLDGVDISTCDRERYSEKVALVSQDPVLFHGSIAENIAYGVPDRLHPVKQEAIENAARLANAHEFIESFPEKYDTHVSGDSVSGGQRQRIAIARALLRNAPVLILDEATSALDAESEAQVQSALDRLMKGRTTLVIAHRLSTIINADQILFIKNGVVAEKGSHNELMRVGGGYRELMATQSKAFIGT